MRLQENTNYIWIQWAPATLCVK